MSESVNIHVPKRAHSTILAALRFYQAAVVRNVGEMPPRSVAQIATDCGAHTAMTADEIDKLCEAIN